MIKSNYNLEETMEFKGWNDFENLARACGYSSCGKNDNGDKTEDEFENSECRDIPNGFQDVDPQLFILIGEILGNILSGRLPFNVQNALGNWLQLVGQVIETYNASSNISKEDQEDTLILKVIM